MKYFSYLLFFIFFTFVSDADGAQNRLQNQREEQRLARNRRVKVRRRRKKMQNHEGMQSRGWWQKNYGQFPQLQEDKQELQEEREEQEEGQTIRVRPLRQEWVQRDEEQEQFRWQEDEQQRQIPLNRRNREMMMREDLERTIAEELGIGTDGYQQRLEKARERVALIERGQHVVRERLKKALGSQLVFSCFVSDQLVNMVMDQLHELHWLYEDEDQECLFCFVINLIFDAVIPSIHIDFIGMAVGQIVEELKGVENRRKIIRNGERVNRCPDTMKTSVRDIINSVCVVMLRYPIDREHLATLMQKVLN